MVMIRPRRGDFCYTTDEFEIMREDLRMCNLLGAAGVVFGLLKRDNRIDVERTSELVSLARTMPVTFHKAIDDSRDLLQSVNQLKNIGISRILTSGGQPTAVEGAEMLRKMIEIAGDELKIIVCGKVTWENFDEIKLLIPSDEYHGRRLVKFWAVNYETDTFWYKKLPGNAISNVYTPVVINGNGKSNNYIPIVINGNGESNNYIAIVINGNGKSNNYIAIVINGNGKSNNNIAIVIFENGKSDMYIPFLNNGISESNI